MVLRKASNVDSFDDRRGESGFTGDRQASGRPLEGTRRKCHTLQVPQAEYLDRIGIGGGAAHHGTVGRHWV